MIRRTTTCFAAFTLLGACNAGPKLHGDWEGSYEIAGQSAVHIELQVEEDLSSKGWRVSEPERWSVHEVRGTVDGEPLPAGAELQLCVDGPCRWTTTAVYLPEELQSGEVRIVGAWDGCPRHVDVGPTPMLWMAGALADDTLIGAIRAGDDPCTVDFEGAFELHRVGR